MDNVKETIAHNVHVIKAFAVTLCKWIVCSGITGIICGLIGSLFFKCIEQVTHFRSENPQILYLLPFGGLLIVFLYQQTNMKNDKGTNQVIRSIRTTEPVPFRMAPLIFISTVITHLFGGSAGREGAALQIGGSLGYSIGKVLKLDEKDVHIIIMCGMSGVFAALFGTPITATIFSMEVISVGVLYYSAFIPCLATAVLSYKIASVFGISKEFPPVAVIPEADAQTILLVAVLAGLCGLLSIIFCLTIHQTEHLYKKIFSNPYLRVFAGGIILVALTSILQTQTYNGAGGHTIIEALQGHAEPEAFAWKIIFTVLTIAAGYKGGEIVPTFFIGATFGNVVGALLGLDPAFGAAVGMIAMFCGVVNCPIASLILGMELFGSDGLILFCITSAISYVLSGYYGLYSSQKIVYSKLSPTFINKGTNEH